MSPLFLRYAYKLRGQPLHLIATGIEARAIVLDVTRNVWIAQFTKEGSSWSVSRMLLKLAVQLPSADPYETTVDLIQPVAVALQPGNELRVFVDPNRRDRLAVDWG
jgi:hypothetical protein